MYANLTTSNLDKIVADINAGQKDAFGIGCQDGAKEPCLFIQHRCFPVAKMLVNLTNRKGASFSATEDSFDKRLVLKDCKKANGQPELVVYDHITDRILLSTSGGDLHGQVFAVAVQPDSTMFGLLAIFDGNGGGAILADTSPEGCRFFSVASSMLNGDNSNG